MGNLVGLYDVADSILRDAVLIDMGRSTNLKKHISEASRYLDSLGLKDLAELVASFKPDRRGEDHNYRVLQRINDEVKKLTGRPCGWGQTLPGQVESLAFCLFQTINALMENSSESEKIGKCYVAKGSDPTLVEACMEWDKVAEKLADLGIRDPPKKAFVIGDKMLIYHGSSEFPDIKLDLAKREVEYDPQRGVSRKEAVDVMKRLWESIGLSCIRGKDDLVCTGLNGKRAREAAAIAAAAPSLEYPFISPDDYEWRKDLLNRLRERGASQQLMRRVENASVLEKLPQRCQEVYDEECAEIKDQIEKEEKYRILRGLIDHFKGEGGSKGWRSLKAGSGKC